MSAVPIADVCSAASSALVDYLVRARQDGLRHFEAERFRGLEVDDEFILRRLWAGMSEGLSPLRMRST
jgi:hypothetical protein